MNTVLKSPTEVMTEFLAALAREDYDSAVALIDVESLEAFRVEWVDVIQSALSSRERKSLREEPARSGGALLFESIQSEEQLFQMSPQDFVRASWIDQKRRAPDIFERLTAASVLGEVREGDDRAHVIYRHSADSAGWVGVSLAHLVWSQRKWRILLTSELAAPSTISAHTM